MRSVVLKKSVRCPRCQLSPRWCVCAAQRPIECPLEIDVLVHHREWYRPSSTSLVINRAIPAARRHMWRRERHLAAAELRVPSRDLWILHPHGGPAPKGIPPEQVQVVLLDGSWRETSTMAQEIAGWGHLVSLPMAGESRYWLRAQADEGRFSTAEALLFLMQSLGLAAAHDELRRQFELHVYASLRARGHKELAALFLRDSPVPAAFPELLAQMHVRRPLVLPAFVPDATPPAGDTS